MEDDGQATTPSSAIVVSEPALPSSATWSQTWRHVGVPVVFGLVVGIVWQEAVMPQLPYNIPNPVHGALLCYLLLAPLMHRWLAESTPERWKEYAMGGCALGLPLMLVWTMGYGGLVCGGYLASVVWIWISTSWWRFQIPPFRFALWHTLGVNVGALGGSIMTYNLLA